MTLAAVLGEWAMYRLRLSESYVLAQSDVPVLETTVGGLLRQRAAEQPAARALVEIGMDGATGRQWTYGELLADAVRLAEALASRYAPANGWLSGRRIFRNGC